MAAAQIGKSFLLEWEGTRTPPSTQIAGLQLGFLRRDIAYAQDGSQIGAYERLVDGGGDSANQHKVIVHLEGISLREMRDALTADTLPEPQRELLLSALRKFLSPVSESQIQGFVESWAGNLNSDEFRKAENRQFVLCIEIECEQLGVDVRASLGLPAVTLDSRF